MNKLFSKALLFTDIHFGLKGNAEQYNSDCLDFISWACTIGKEQNCDTCIFLGDYHNNRSAINLRTLAASLKGLEMLSSSFEQIFFIPGNHDLYYRENRSVYSFAWAKHIKNIKIINELEVIGDCLFAPWLIDDEWEKLSSFSTKYVFGHFEIPGFLMNTAFKMPDKGSIKETLFSSFDEVYTGHFHHRQQQGKINYIGNAFPQNFSDVNDDARGLGILEWGKEILFYSWPKQPLYIKLNLSDLLATAESPSKLLKPNQYARIITDLDITFKETMFLKEMFLTEYNLRDISFIKEFTSTNNSSNFITPSEMVSVRQVIYNHLNQIESTKYDKQTLIELFNNA